MQAEEKKSIEADLLPMLALALRAVGIEVLELKTARTKAALNLRVIIYCASGTGTAECTKAHRILAALLLEHFATENAFIEVSSPGTDRVLKSLDEFRVFRGAQVRVLTVDDSEWLVAKIGEVFEDGFELISPDAVVVLKFSDILKAKLYNNSNNKNNNKKTSVEEE